MKSGALTLQRPWAFLCIMALMSFHTAAQAQEAELRVLDSSVPVIVTCMGKGGAVYRHQLYIENTNEFICDSAEIGRKVELGPFRRGTELIFSLKVIDTGHTFFTGDGARNPDDEIHAKVTVQQGGYLVSFEDQFGLGDQSYNNASFHISNLTTEKSSCSRDDNASLTRDTFCQGDGGWRVSGDAQGGSVRPDHKKQDGQEYLEATDDAVGGVWFWHAPGRYTGNLCDFYGGEMTFQIRQSRLEDPFDDADLIFQGSAGRLTYDFPNPPGTGWTDYAVDIEEGEGWSGAETEAEFKAVLANVTDLYIRGEFRTGDDVGGLNQVELASAGFIYSWFVETDDCHAIAETKPRLRFVALKGGEWRPISETSAFETPIAIEVDYPTAQDEAEIFISATLNDIALEGLPAQRQFDDPSLYRTRQFTIISGEPATLSQAYASGPR